MSLRLRLFRDPSENNPNCAVLHLDTARTKWSLVFSRAIKSFPNMNKKQLILIFFIALISRVLFSQFSGVEVFGGDWGRYDDQSNNILKGEFNLEGSLFITAPLYSYLVAGLKYIFKSTYAPVLELLQILLSAVSAIYLTKTAQLIFKKNNISFICGIFYGVYPVTLYFTHTFGQESIFQSLFIVTIYFISKFLCYKQRNDLILFSILFSLALLTKSHILLIIPFFLAGLIIIKGVNYDSISDVIIVVGVIFLLTLPYGIYNKMVNGVYVISSSGQGGHFLTGHNDDTYTYLVDSPPRDTLEYKRLKSMDYMIFRNLAPKLDGLTHAEKQSLYLRTGFDWIKNNPIKAVKLFFVNLRNFLMPGFNIQHYPFNAWLSAFIMSAPIFVFAYIEIVRGCITNYKEHIPILSIFLGMLLFSLGFYTQNRFRVITLEPFYVMYACAGFVRLFEYRRENRFRNRDVI